jgi:hypothetical protein
MVNQRTASRGKNRSSGKHNFRLYITSVKSVVAMPDMANIRKIKSYFYDNDLVIFRSFTKKEL